MLRIVHSAGEEIKTVKPKAPTRKEKAMRWMQQQEAQDKQRADAFYQEELKKIRVIDPTFQL